MRRWLALLLIISGSAACNWDRGVGPGRPVQEIIATVEGQSWVATTRTASYSSQTLIVEGVSSSQVRIRIRIPGITAAGTYFASQNNPSGPTLELSMDGGTWSSVATGGDGFINLTLLAENRAAGTFRFNGFPFGGTATGVKIITDGRFALDYTQ